MGLMIYNNDWKAIRERFLPSKSTHQVNCIHTASFHVEIMVFVSCLWFVILTVVPRTQYVIILDVVYHSVVC